MRVAFVHYHIKSGGVTRVMENALAALLETIPNAKVVTLCGEAPPEDCILPNRVGGWNRIRP